MPLFISDKWTGRYTPCPLDLCHGIGLRPPFSALRALISACSFNFRSSAAIFDPLGLNLACGLNFWSFRPQLNRSWPAASIFDPSGLNSIQVSYQHYKRSSMCLDHVWKRTNLSTSTKIRVYSSCVLVVFLYSSETWTLTRLNLKRLDSFHTQCQRRILHIR